MDYITISVLVIFIILVLLIKMIKIVPEGYEWVVEDLGKKRNVTLKPGLNFLHPFFSRVRAKVSMKEQTQTIQTTVIAKGNIKTVINSIFIYKILNPITAVYSVDNLVNSINKLINSTLCGIINDNMDLIQIMDYREKINNDVLKTVNTAVKSWGCTVSYFHIQGVVPPKDIQYLFRQYPIEQMTDTSNENNYDTNTSNKNVGNENTTYTSVSNTNLNNVSTNYDNSTSANTNYTNLNNLNLKDTQNNDTSSSSHLTRRRLNRRNASQN